MPVAVLYIGVPPGPSAVRVYDSVNPETWRSKFVDWPVVAAVDVGDTDTESPPPDWAPAICVPTAKIPIRDRIEMKRSACVTVPPCSPEGRVVNLSILPACNAAMRSKQYLMRLFLYVSGNGRG